MSNKSNGSTRQLRNKYEVQKKVFFDFDDVNGLLHQNDKIDVVDDTDYTHLSCYYKEAVVELPKKPINLVTHPHNVCECTDDPLADHVYGHFHRKMRKEEKVMANEEKNRVLSDIDTLNSFKQLLEQYDWIRHLPTITRIKNVNDITELELKKELTIAEIARLNRKHENWKKRVDAMVSDVREYESGAGEKDEYAMSLSELRRIRRREKVRKYGPVIKLILPTGCLVFDPVLPVRVIKSKKRGIQSAQVRDMFHQLSGVEKGEFFLPDWLRKEVAVTRKDREEFRQKRATNEPT